MANRQPNLMALLALVSALLTPPLVSAADTLSRTSDELRRLEKQQEVLLRDLKAKLLMLSESPRKDELKAMIAEIERRMNAPQDLYLSPGSKLTPMMEAYYSRMQRRIEDCGTRHFPLRNGRKVHVTALVAIALDRDGRVIKTDILKSSGERPVDLHIPKLVSASAPFGRLPEDVELDGNAPYRNLVVATRFSFVRDEKPLPEDLPESDRCRWK